MSQAKPEGTQGIGDLLGGLAGDVQDLVRGEISLARAELGEKVQKTANAGSWIGGGALLGFAGLIILLEGIAQVLGRAVPLWLAFVIVGLVVVIAAAALIRSGMARLSGGALVPTRTTNSLQKDANMLKEHV